MLVAVRPRPEEPRSAAAGAGARGPGLHARPAAQTPVRFTLDWRFEGPAAPFTVALDKGYFKAEGLDVTIDPAAGSREPISRVGSGTYDMGFGDINSLVRFRDENPSGRRQGGDDPLRPAALRHRRPPQPRHYARAREPRTAHGFGAPAADAAYAQWPIFKAVNKIDETEWAMRIENVGFPVREPMLAQGEVDAVFGFAMTSYINLKSRGVPADDIVVMLMSEHGVDLYGNAVLVSQKFAAEKPEAVKGFLRALAKGLRDTIADPGAAVDTVLKRNERRAQGGRARAARRW